MIVFDDSILAYLRGEKFHPEVQFRIADKHPERETGSVLIPDRFSLLPQICRGRRVLHLGCCDHLPVIAEKRADGLWMHDHLVAAATKCVGIDIDAQAVSYLVEQLSLEDIYCHDMTQLPLPKPIADETWDVLVAGEILEHIANPADFLSRLSQTLTGKVTSLVLTVPNGLKRGNYKSARRGMECINSDHRFWFTPYTLAKVVCDAGLTPRSFAFCMCEPVDMRWGWHGFWRRRRLIRYPAFRDNVLLVAELPHETSSYAALESEVGVSNSW